MTVKGGVRVPRVDFLISGLRLIAEGRRGLSAYIAARQPKRRTVGRAAAYQMLWVRGSETIPFPGPDSIFSSRCGAISGRPNA
jgi:hypothetical protein